MYRPALRQLYRSSFAVTLRKNRSSTFTSVNNIKKFNKIKMRPFCTSRTNPDLSSMQSTDEEKILQFLNTCSARELRSIEMLTQEQASYIWNRRKTDGLFSSLQSFTSVLSMDEDAMGLLCSHLLTLSTSKTNNSVLKKYFSPELSLKDIGAFSSVTGLEVCLDSICFAHLTNNLELMSWDHVPFPEGSDKKLHPIQIFEMAHSLVERLPETDVYIMEQQDTKSKRSNSKSVSQQLFITQMQMSILHLLNKDFDSNRYHKVFFARKYFVNKTFHLIVGGERVSGQHLVKDLENDKLPDKLTISSQQRHHFFRLSSDLQRERYTNALLLPLAFLKLGEQQEDTS